MLNSKQDLSYTFNDFSQIYQATNQKDSAIYYAYKGVDISKQITLKNQLLRSYQYLASLYKDTGPIDSAYKYLTLTVNTKDSIYSNEKTKQVELITVREQNRQREIEQQKLDLQNKIKIYALIAGLIVFTFIGFILFRNSRKEKNAKILLQKKNELIEQTLSDLKATQSQLIQSEKMASLGELTAGIAHEIQNPLNFVNNFSEVSNELIDEMNEEIAKGNYEEVKAIAVDVKQNLEKINHHGKRADAIVKGMLQHSRSSNGAKEPTDINKLTDEYLRLAYHGIRAKDNSFNATLKTDFDESIGNINIIPQDIGRVILNLITNAFYVVDEKKKQVAAQGLPTFERLATLYEPTVSVSTKKVGDKVEIKVADNGNGIPQKLLDKIFQPFFTTKPTGQGTGLGLSLSYDIVKAHSGELKVETKEGEGSTFTIQLPFNTQ
jgi:signal transduction histidine kinase